MTTDTRLRAAWAAWATWACKRRKPPHVRPTQVGPESPGRRLPGLFLAKIFGEDQADTIAGLYPFSSERFPAAAISSAGSRISRRDGFRRRAHGNRAWDLPAGSLSR
jgi:hypothetical protein